MLADLIERDAVASVIRTRCTKVKSATWKRASDDFRDVPYAIVVSRITNIEDFVVDCFTGCREHRDDRASNVQPVDQRPPWRAVAGHANLFRGPCQSGEIVQHDVKA